MKVAEMSSGYSSPVPVDVVKLGYLGIEFEMWAMAGNRRKADLVAAEIRSTWDTVKPQVVANGGATEAREFDATMKQLRQARSPGQYVRLAGAVLDQVDYLEKVFA